ncbi:MAG: hypothetical protein IPP71_09835 [Bacteroidetes bacterium]|nr:hypothetical protein [Bacteroidota bacterium]
MHASVRAKHTIEQIGGVAILITEFNRVGSFDHIPEGPETNKELQKLTKRIINLNIPVIEIPYQEPPKHKSLSQIYDYLFQYLSIRAQHILSNIETLYIGPDSSRNIKLLINDYIYHKIDLRKFRNLGAKTEEEIKIFVKNVMNVHLNGEQNNLMFGDKRKEVAFVRKAIIPESDQSNEVQ